MSNEVHEGQVLAGKFRIERVLGQGGMGVVVAATHLQLDERVALKFLLPDALSNPEAVERFAREARAAVKIKSEHVARVSDVGTLESGSPYMVMEYLEGQDLAGFVHSTGAMAVPLAVEFVLQACEAIGEAHALGIVHRDLKPANLFVTRRVDGSPCIKVLDFGISKLTAPGGGADLGMTKTSTVMGSPLYMSPEQMSSTRNVDMRTDIWALGVILYEILTGRVPFEAETMPQLCGMILQDPPRPLRDLRPDLPDALQAVIFRCLEKSRERRFANVADLAAALAPFGAPSAQRSADRISRVLGAAGIPSTPNLGVVANASTDANTSSNWGASQSPKKSRAPLFIALLAGLLVLGGGLMLVLQKRAAVESAAEPLVSAVVAPVLAQSAPMSTAAPAPPMVQPELPASPSSASPVLSQAPEPVAAPAQGGPPPTHKAGAHAAAVKPAPAAPAAKPKPVAAQPVAPGIDPLDGRR
ncbi:MAG TPA: protein kinase [Polyangiaceae bacterium]|jgi:serine/threonine-protein kinase